MAAQELEAAAVVPAAVEDLVGDLAADDQLLTAVLDQLD